MNFDTPMIAPLPPEGVFSAPCTEDDLEQSPYGAAKIPLDSNGRPVGISLDDTMASLARKLIEFYGEGFRTKVNHYRAGRGLDPL